MFDLVQLCVYTDQFLTSDTVTNGIFNLLTSELPQGEHSLPVGGPLLQVVLVIEVEEIRVILVAI